MLYELQDDKAHTNSPYDTWLVKYLTWEAIARSEMRYFHGTL